MYLPNKKLEALRELNTHRLQNVPPDGGAFDGRVMRGLVDLGLATGDKSTGWTITARGIATAYNRDGRVADLDAAAVEGAEAAVAQPVDVVAEAAVARGLIDVVAEAAVARSAAVAQPVAAPVAAPSAADCPGCDCIYRQALDLVAAKHPAVVDLVAALKKLQGV